jgi:predicted DNA binding CopG/RHH family protein
MNKKYDPEKVKLSSYEQSIEDAIDYGKLKRPSAKRIKSLKAAATATLKVLKDTRANIRINGLDMLALRRRAQEAGLPYQTFIAHIMHLYLTDQLVSLKEVQKMADAGIFGRRKTGS